MAYINDDKHYVYRGGGEAEDFIYIQNKILNETIAIPVSLFDELVVMRYPQLIEGHGAERVENRVWKKHNQQSGAQALGRAIGKIDVSLEIKGGFKKKDV